MVPSIPYCRTKNNRLYIKLWLMLRTSAREVSTSSMPPNSEPKAKRLFWTETPRIGKILIESKGQVCYTYLTSFKGGQRNEVHAH